MRQHIWMDDRGHARVVYVALNSWVAGLVVGLEWEGEGGGSTWNVECAQVLIIIVLVEVAMEVCLPPGGTQKSASVVYEGRTRLTMLIHSRLILHIEV